MLCYKLDFVIPNLSGSMLIQGHLNSRDTRALHQPTCLHNHSRNQSGAEKSEDSGGDVRCLLQLLDWPCPAAGRGRAALSMNKGCCGGG